MSFGLGIGQVGGAPVEAGGGDPLWNNVELLIEFTGDDQATTATDLSKNERTVTFHGNAQIDSNTLLLDGTGDYASVPSVAADTPGTGPFCWEMSMALTENNSSVPLFMVANAAGTQHIVSALDDYAVDLDTIIVQTQTSNDYTLNSSSDDLFPDGIPFSGGDLHLCVERDDQGVLRAMVNGTVVIEVANTEDLDATPELITIGAPTWGTGNMTKGRVSRVRWTVGAHRYGGAYTPSNEPFPTS